MRSVKLIKKSFKCIVIVFVVLVAISFFIENANDNYSQKNNTSASAQISEKDEQAELSVSDFKLNDNISKTIKMLKTKGWRPGDGDKGEMESEYNGSHFSGLGAYGYIMHNGIFEGYSVPYIQISYDEYNKLAHFRIVINTLIDTDEVKKVASDEGIENARNLLNERRENTFREVQKKCLIQYGYSPCEEENEDGDFNSYIYGYRNKNGDICKLKVQIIDYAPIYEGEDYIFETDFTLDYVSARYRNEEKLANKLMNDYYGM